MNERKYTQLKVERDYPIPTRRHGIFTEMVVGLVVGESVEMSEKHRAAITLAAWRHGVPITTRRTRLGFFRLWRMSLEDWVKIGYGREQTYTEFFEIVPAETSELKAAA